MHQVQVAHGRGIAAVREVETADGGRVDLGRVELPAAGAIAGTVVAETGAPAPGVSVVAACAETGARDFTRAGADGSFAFAALGAGDWEISATPAEGFGTGWPRAAQNVAVAAGETAQVALHLQAGP
jgi:hypothetical protein